MGTKTDWRDLAREFDGVRDGKRELCAEKHPYRYVMTEDFPDGILERRWWTVSGGSPKVIRDFQTVATAAASLLGFHCDEPGCWQSWLDFLQENGIGNDASGPWLGNTLTGICAASRRACRLLAIGELLPPKLATEPSAVSADAPAQSDRISLLAVLERHDGKNREELKSLRRKAVDAFIKSVWIQQAERVTKTDIWRVTGYRDRSQFDAWQRADQGKGYNPHGSVDERIRATLNLPPKEFLKKRKPRKSEDA